MTIVIPVSFEFDVLGKVGFECIEVETSHICGTLQEGSVPKPWDWRPCSARLNLKKLKSSKCQL